MNPRVFYLPYFCSIIIVFSFTIPIFYETLVEYKEAQQRLQVALDEYAHSQAELQETLDKFENFLFVKSAFQLGFYERVSEDCFMKGDLAFCKRDASPRQYNEQTGNWEYKYSGELADFPKMEYYDALDEGTT